MAAKNSKSFFSNPLLLCGVGGAIFIGLILAFRKSNPAKKPIEETPVKPESVSPQSTPTAIQTSVVVKQESPMKSAAASVKASNKLLYAGGKEVYLKVGHADNPLAGDYFRDRSGVESAIPASGELMTIPEDSHNTNGFDTLTKPVKAKKSGVEIAIEKLSEMYVSRPNEGLGIWGFSEYWLQDRTGKPVLAGIKVLSGNNSVKEVLPETFEGYTLYFHQAGVEVRKDLWTNKFWKENANVALLDGGGKLRFNW